MPKALGAPDDAGSSTRRKPVETPVAAASQRSRAGTRPITVHMPTDVRDQLKILAIRLGMPMNRLIVEFFNDGFAKHGLPQIARLKDED